MLTDETGRRESHRAIKRHAAVRRVQRHDAMIECRQRRFRQPAPDAVALHRGRHSHHTEHGTVPPVLPVHGRADEPSLVLRRDAFAECHHEAPVIETVGPAEAFAQRVGGMQVFQRERAQPDFETRCCNRHGCLFWLWFGARRRWSGIANASPAADCSEFGAATACWAARAPTHRARPTSCLGDPRPSRRPAGRSGMARDRRWADHRRPGPPRAGPHPDRCRTRGR